jgi:hypothetical protein
MRFLRQILFAAALLCAPLAAAAKDDPDEEPVILGYVEEVFVGNIALAMRGKLDTGADSSSVHARDVELYDKNGRDTWVRFKLIGKDGRTVKYDQNVIRFAHIKSKTGGTIRRPVIRLPLCVGGKRGHAEVNLADRGEFDFDILVGREFLADRIVVDSGQSFIAGEACGPANDK